VVYQFNSGARASGTVTVGIADEGKKNGTLLLATISAATGVVSAIAGVLALH
jgi:hypothetical protein